MAARVAAVARGDRRAFAALFGHFAPRLVTYLTRAGSSVASAEELAQETMVLVWRKSASFDPARGAASTWIFRIARNLRIDRHRQGRAGGPTLDLDDIDLADPAPSPDARLGALQWERRVRDALHRLPSEQCRLLHLSYFSEWSHSEIARELRMPLGTVKSHIRRALVNLRQGFDTLER